MNLIQAIKQNNKRRQMAELRNSVKALSHAQKRLEGTRAQMKAMGMNPYNILGDLDEA